MYQDLLSKIRNAGLARKDSLLVPFSDMDFSISKILANGGYVKEAQKKTISRKNFIEIRLDYNGRDPILKNFKIISRPSRHLYFGYRELKTVKHGYGLGVVSTPKGVMTVSEARHSKLGGEYLFEVW
ncbi:MAG: small subunit ribosomal protein S8 [Parcubacteria group bacterium Gr01-1014_20]|nr:MAG: small subunit ribosomal protein S8 [Parcubacteria group bacterium Gr01-1014_20]